MPVDLLKGEQKGEANASRNPSKKVPTLELPSGDFLTQSVAQLEYLEEAHPNPALLPHDPLLRARCRALCQVINADTAPMQTPFIQKRHSSEADEQLLWAQEWITKGFDAFDSLLSSAREQHSLNGEFCLGNSISMADLFLIPQIYNGIRYELDIESKWPQLWQTYQACLATEACQKSSPEHQIDAPKSS